LIINSDTAFWKPTIFNTTNTVDYANDQTGAKVGDIVGDAKNPAFYTKFDNADTPSLTDGTLAFRVRLAEAKNYKKMDFNYNVFIGIDANNDHAVDLFVGANNSPRGKDKLGIWYPGTGPNTGPSTTTINKKPLMTFNEVIGVTYDFSKVVGLDTAATSFDLDGGGKPDVFISFSFDFSYIVKALADKGITINEISPHLSYILATATKDNALNMDIAGIKGGTSSSLTFAELGAWRTPLTATGSAPEPAVISLLGAGCLTLLARRRLTEKQP
jgi:hypothetical protein